ncbi:poly(R)-hydroxyalkanoic acid synthase subunit PhaE [Clostridiaceae bacterium 35-E11]
MYAQNLYNEYVGQWIHAQKQMLESWQESFSPKPSEEASTKSNTATQDLEDSTEAFHQWSKTNYDFFTKTMKLYTKNPMSDIFGKIAKGATMYENMYEFWKDIPKKYAESDPGQIKKFYDKWQSEYTKNLSNYFMGFFPQPVQDLFSNSTEIWQMYFQTSSKFYAPWLTHSQNFQELTEKILSGDKEAFLNYVKLWKENYETTFGKVFDFPILGMHREYFEKQVDSMNSFMNYLNAFNEFAATIYRVGAETMEKIMKDYHEMLKDGTQPKTFKAFYEYWWKQNEEAYKNLFKTDDFSKLLSQVVDAGFVFKKDFDKVLEQQLGSLPLPTKSDMHSIYKTIYHLKKEVRTLNKEISILSNMVNNQSTNA